MRRITFTLISTLLLISNFGTVAQAQGTSVSLPSSAPIVIPTALEPQVLAGVAYQGILPGIPGYAGLIAGYASGRVTALDVVKAAVQDQRVSAQMLNDRQYIADVDSALQSQVHDR